MASSISTELMIFELATFQNPASQTPAIPAATRPMSSGTEVA